jgi:hypothetical protein
MCQSCGSGPFGPCPYPAIHIQTSSGSYLLTNEPDENCKTIFNYGYFEDKLQSVENGEYSDSESNAVQALKFRTHHPS